MAYMKDICLCISSIAAVELPHGLWQDFISTMASQANQNENRFFKYAGIYNLGLVMETLEPQDFQKNDLEIIWQTMITNMVTDDQDPQQLRLELVSQAVKRMAPITGHYFAEENRQVEFMTGIFNMLNTLSHKNVAVFKQTLEGLIDIIKINY